MREKKPTCSKKGQNKTTKGRFTIYLKPKKMNSSNFRNCCQLYDSTTKKATNLSLEPVSTLKEAWKLAHRRAVDRIDGNYQKKPDKTSAKKNLYLFWIWTGEMVARCIIQY